MPGGRCEACQGEGEVRVEMQFLADVFVPCDQCDGKRFKPQVLEVRYRGRSIHQVLDLTVREALTFFSSSPKVLRRLQVLDEIGLGYLRLGQPATTLSGGEAQRIKIAAHLSSHGGERLLYILDEPTTGLHFDDIAKLLTAFSKLLEAGHTLLVIEHNLDVIKTADYIIDLGPEGGDAGGQVVATGTPEQVAQIEASYTGRYLRPVLAEGRSHAYAAGRERPRGGEAPATVLRSSDARRRRAICSARCSSTIAAASRTSGVIVEVEAYIGESDPACHAAPGPTRRNEPLYGPPGLAYVYLNYGIHCLVNVVTEADGSPAAVLIRALEPLDGIGVMRRRRATTMKGRRPRYRPRPAGARALPRPGQSDDGDGDHAGRKSG